MKALLIPALAAAVCLPALVATAAPARPAFKSALSSKVKIDRIKTYGDGKYDIYRLKGDNRFVVETREFPYTTSGIFDTYRTLDCVTGWTAIENKDHEKWLPVRYTHVPTVHRSNKGVLQMFRGYCNDMGIKPKF